MGRSLILVSCITFALSGMCYSQTIPVIRISEVPKSKRVDVFIGKGLFTSLLYADSLKKSVLYPVIGVNNVEVTRGWPIKPKIGDQVDHPHQIGVWFNYGDVNGADYWNNSTKIDTNSKAYGEIKFEKILSAKSGKGRATLVTQSVWVNPKGKQLLQETSTYIFRIIGKVRIIDRHTRLKALENVQFKDNKEGLFAIRVARELEYPSQKPVKVFKSEGIKSVVENQKLSGNYQNSLGVTGEAVFGTRSNWLSLSGIVDNKPVSIAIIDHPKNVGYPGYWMARGYGLFAINPLGAEFYTNGKEKLNFSLDKGSDTTFKHRLVLSDTLTQPQLTSLFNSFKTQ